MVDNVCFNYHPILDGYISYPELRLLKGETVTLSDLVSTAKKKYSAEAKIENGKVKFQFAPMDNLPSIDPITEQ